MLLFYTSVIRSVLEYVAPVWHSSLTAEQKDSLENVLKRAFLVIYGERFANRTCSYHEFCRKAGSLSLADRREGLSYKFFKKMIRPDSCIHHLIPEKGMRVYCLDLEIRRNTLFLLHVLKDLRRLLFYMLCAVFRRIFLKIYVTILLTFSDS